MDAKKTSGHGGHGRRARCIMITIFAEREEELRLLDPNDWPRCTYLVYQRELCPTTFREHFQGYAEFDRQIPFSVLHTYEGLTTAHFETRQGTQKQAIDYCTKTETRLDGPWFWGEEKKPGVNQRLFDAANDLQDGKTLHAVQIAYPDITIKHPNGLAKLAQAHAVPRSEHTICFVFYGAGGTGKTTFAHKLASYLGTRTYVLPAAKGSGLYWDGYQQGDVVIIDEFKGNRMQPTEFNMLVDKVPHKVPIHGNTTEFNSKYIIITTNVSPMQWWPTLEYKRSLRRRIIIFPIFRNLAYHVDTSQRAFRHCVLHGTFYAGPLDSCLQCLAHK